MNADKINQLLQAGLAKNLKRIDYYRVVMMNPRSSLNTTVYRNLAADILDTLVDQVLNDSVLYNRLRQNLLVKNRKAGQSTNVKVPKNVTLKEIRKIIKLQ